MAADAPPALVFGIIGGVFALAAAAITWLVRSNRKRDDGFREYADRSGGRYTKKADNSIISNFDGIELFQLGRPGSVSNLIERDGSEKLWIFDYIYRTGGSIRDQDRASFSVGGVTVSSGRGRRSHSNTQTHFFTVAAVSSRSLNLPQFTLTRANILTRLASTIGFQDIDLPDHPQFSKKYLLQGRDEQSVRAIFTAELARLFEDTENVCMGGGRNLLVIYTRQAVAPSDLQSFEALLLELKSMFEKA